MTGSSAIRYHMSRIPHVPGDVLCGNGRPKVDPVVESLLEDRRPKDLLSRYHAVFTVNIPDFRRLGVDRGYIYSVEVPLPEQVHDTHWLGRIEVQWIIEKRRALPGPSRWIPAYLDPLCDKY